MLDPTCGISPLSFFHYIHKDMCESRNHHLLTLVQFLHDGSKGSRLSREKCAGGHLRTHVAMEGREEDGVRGEVTLTQE